MKLGFSSTKNWCWHTRLETPRTHFEKLTGSLAVTPIRIACVLANLSQEWLVPFASLSTISGTFNSLFKVLFIFPSWYLYTIGLEPIFSFRWNLPPTLRSNPEERDSKKTHRTQRTVNDERDSHPFLRSFPTVLHLRLCWLRFYRLQFKTDKLPGFTYWAVPCSFAITKGILFSFFSSAYLYA